MEAVALFAVQLVQQIGCAVDDQVLIGEVRRGVIAAEQLEAEKLEAEELAAAEEKENGDAEGETSAIES